MNSLAMLALVIPHASAVELPYEQSFEGGLQALEADGWNMGSATVVEAHSYAGERCLRVEAPEGKPTYVSLYVPAQPGKFYGASTQVRCEGVEQSTAGSQNRGAVIFLQWASHQRGHEPGGTFPKGLHGDQEWAERTVPYTREIPERVGFVQLLLGVEGKGTAWFDEVSLFEVDEWGGTEPTSPADGATVDERLPLLTWTPPDNRHREAEITLSQSPALPEGQALTLVGRVGRWRPDAPLEPGTWHWRVQAMSGGLRLPPGKVHSFTVTEGAPVWPPEVEPRWLWTDEKRPELEAVIHHRDDVSRAFATIDDKPAELLAERLAERGETIRFRPKADLQPGVHDIAITLTGPGDRKLTHTDVLSTKPPASRVAIREDNILLVDDEPFFPIGAYRDPSDRLDDFSGLHEAGFNLTHSYEFEGPGEPKTEAARTYLRAAHEAGVKVFMGLSRGMVREGNHAALRRFAAELMDEPALLTWYLMDEPALHGLSPDATTRLSGRIGGIDPFHPTSIVCCRPNTFGDYGQTADIFWNDPYPVPSRPLSMVDDWARAGRKAAGDSRPYWTVLQGHDLRYWGDFDQAVKDLGPVRTPTLEQTRCMAFTALADGANGLVWYWGPNQHYHMQRDAPEAWRGICSVVSELNSLMPWLTALRTADDVVAVPDPLRAWTREADGVRVLVVVSTQEVAASAEVDLTAFGTDTVCLRGSDEEAALGEGVLTAELPPHGVLVYEWDEE